MGSSRTAAVGRRASKTGLPSPSPRQLLNEQPVVNALGVTARFKPLAMKPPDNGDLQQGQPIQLVVDSTAVLVGRLMKTSAPQSLVELP